MFLKSLLKNLHLIKISQKSCRFFNQRTNEPITVGLIDAPIRCGQPRAGVELGPEAIRNAGLKDKFEAYEGISVRDHGAIPFDLIVPEAGDYFDDQNCSAPLINPRLCGNSNERISKGIQQVLRKNDIGVVLGGDHSLAVGSIHGHGQIDENICVLWVDAHCDMNHPRSTGSGNLHGMPLHFIMNALQSKRSDLPSFNWCKPMLQSSNIGFIAIRDIDPGEIALLREHNIAHSSIREIDRNGIAHCVERILDMINPL